MLGFVKGDTMVLACRGTASGSDWFTNYRIALKYVKPWQHPQEVPHIAKSVALANDWVSEQRPKTVIVTGHSLGANVAKAVWSSLPINKSSRFLVTFNGYLPFELFPDPQVVHYRTKKDPVSLLVSKSPNTIVVPQRTGSDPHEMANFFYK